MPQPAPLPSSFDDNNIAFSEKYMLKFNHYIYLFSILLSRVLLYSLIIVPEQKVINQLCGYKNRRINAHNENRQRMVLA